MGSDIPALRSKLRTANVSLENTKIGLGHDLGIYSDSLYHEKFVFGNKQNKLAILVS